MLVGITYDLRQEYLELGFDDEETVEFDRIDTVEAIESTLRELGYETDRIGNVRRLMERLARGDRWDVVFNIAEGLYGFGREAQVPAVLDAFAIPYTFSDPMVCAISLHKAMCKRLARDAGVPTADFAEVSRIEDVDAVDLPYPLFAKPVAEGTSKGVTAGSKITSREELRAACQALLDKFRQPVLVESFLPGREFTVGIIGTGDKAFAVGAMEVVLLDKAEQEVYSYANKKNWEDRVEYRLGDPSDPVVARSIEIALMAWRGLKCRDAGRIDVRADASGQPKFIEVNPLSGLHPDISDLPILCRLAGMSFKDLLARVMESAMERIPLRPAILPAGLPAEAAPPPVVAPVEAAPAKPAKPVPRTPQPRKPSARRVVILHERVDPNAPADRQDLLREMEFLSGILARLDYQVITHPISLDLRAVAHALRRYRPAAVLNMAETVDGRGALVHLAPAILDRIGIPYTGSGTEAMFLTGNKLLGKKLLREAGLPTPRWLTMDQVAAGEITFPPPYIIKSVWEDASVGLDEDSVIHDPGSLLEQLERRLSALGGSAFVEEYVDGREFNVGLLTGPGGPEVLPIAEMRFHDYPEGKVRIMGYRAKWDEHSFEYEHTQRSFDLPVEDGPLLARLQEIAMRCWELFELHGYARVDFRVAADGTPYVLEANANPCLAPESGLMASAARAGLAPEQVLSRILGDLNRARQTGELFLVNRPARRPRKTAPVTDDPASWAAKGLGKAGNGSGA